MTYLRTGTLQFTFDGPRFRWDLGEVSGVECLIPRERLDGAWCTGDDQAFKLLSEPSELDRAKLLDFVNEHTGLLVGDGQPSPEPIWRWEAEAAVLGDLWLLRKMRLATLESQRWTRRSSGAPRQRADSASAWVDATVSRLSELLPQLRTQCANALPVPFDGTPEHLAMAWINATAAEHWVPEVRAPEWALSPMIKRAGSLARVRPVIRCRTLLGYVYAGLLAAYEDSYRVLELLRAGKMPGVDLVPGRCQLCGEELGLFHESGRKRRQDAKWCDTCRQLRNTAAQRKRRSRSGQAPAA